MPEQKEDEMQTWKTSLKRSTEKVVAYEKHQDPVCVRTFFQILRLTVK